MVSSEWPKDMSQEMNAIPLPVLTGFVSVGSVLSTKFGNPWAAHVGAVAKSARASLLMTAAHHRDKASPVLTPHRFPPIEHSLSSASNNADTRGGIAERRAHLNRRPCCEVEPHMVGATSSVGPTVEREDDDVYRPALRAKKLIVCVHNPVSVFDEILGVLQTSGAKRRVHKDGHLSGRACADELRGAGETRPLRRQRWATTRPRSRLFESVVSLSGEFLHTV